MKKILSIATALCIVLNLSAQNYNVEQSDFSQVRISFSTPSMTISSVNLFGNSFTELSLENFSSQTAVGQPALPTLVKTIEIPLGDGLKYRIVSMQCDTIDGASLGIDNAIVPAQPSRSKSDTTHATLSKDNAVYGRNAFCGAPTIELEAIGISRDRNLATIKFNPIQWNPVTNQLIVVKNITVSVHQQNTDIEATRRMQRLYASPAFNSGNGVINSIGSKDNHTSTPLRYTIIAHSSFRGALDEFAAWKARKGFLVDLVYTDDANVGSSTNSIKSYLQGLYDNATADSPAPTYVLFVGDVAQIPAFSLTSYDGPHSSDLSYCCWTGNDYLPDCYYGRFSAQNLTQLTPQISKTLMYEQYTFPDPSYLGTAALIAGVDHGYSNDNGYKYGDPAMDYVAKLYITNSNGFNDITYYKNNTSFAPTGVTVTGSSQTSSVANTLRTLYNRGCGWVNYTAHGSETSWSEPSFTTSNASALTNNNKPMIMIGNCCLSNSFQVDACLGEAVLRKDNNAGAVGYIGGSNSTYWVEDFYWTVGVRSNISNTCNTDYSATNKGMYDRLFHTHNEAYSDWYTSMGAIIHAGNMAVQSSSSDNLMKEYYWQIYHLMGDPSLMPYFGQPSQISANIPSSIPAGSNSLTIEAVPYAYVALTAPDGHLISAAFANATGTATLTFDPITLPGEYEVAISAQNHIQFFQTVNIVSNGPYLIVDNMSVNGRMHAGGDVDFDLDIRNVGIENVGDFSVEFIVDGQSMLLNAVGQDTISQPTPIAPDQTITLTGKGAAHIWENVTDQKTARVSVIVRWGTHSDQTSRASFDYTIDAPRMRFTSYTLTENQGNHTLNLLNSNLGNDTVHQGTSKLLSLDPGITLTGNQWTLSNVAPGQGITTSVTLGGNIPENTLVTFIQITNDGYKTTMDTIDVIFGIDPSLVTFEQNNWGNLEVTQGQYPWSITSEDVFEGTYCIRSYKWTGYNTGNRTSEFNITWTSVIDDSITFYKNVSSEENYDEFHFYIDNVEKETLSGTNNTWSRSAWFVPAGTHTFRFAYSKDYSQTRGSDCAWIDNIHMPLNGIYHSYMIDSVCAGDTYIFGSDTIETAELGAGIYVYTDSTEYQITNLMLVVSTPVEAYITASDTQIRAGESVRLTASQNDNIIWSTGATVPIIDVYPTETTTYTLIAFNGRCSSTASVTVTVQGSIDINTDAERDATSILLYPNPATNTVTLCGAHINRIIVNDMMGRTVESRDVDAEQYTVDITTLTPGVYIIQVFGNDARPTIKKFIKK